MPTPTQTLTPAQIELAREVMGENSYSLVAGLISGGATQGEADAKWAATLADIEEWNADVRGNHADLDGKVKMKASDLRAEVRYRVRTRYGLTGAVGAEVVGDARGSYSVPAVTYF
ncbi:MAG TPA: hypothetical protein VK421_06070 [Pyrinomonadaceae bacterium]|nr:hypothetical protein [Pyrinomonadaceae bacterium]